MEKIESGKQISSLITYIISTIRFKDKETYDEHRDKIKSLLITSRYHIENIKQVKRIDGTLIAMDFLEGILEQLEFLSSLDDERELFQDKVKEVKMSVGTVVEYLENDSFKCIPKQKQDIKDELKRIIKESSYVRYVCQQLDKTYIKQDILNHLTDKDGIAVSFKYSENETKDITDKELIEILRNL